MGSCPLSADPLGYQSLWMVALMFIALGLTVLFFTLRQGGPTRHDRSLAFIDALTGLANRRKLDHDIDDLVRGALVGRPRSATTAPTAVIMLDIDHFKSVNDQYGHRYGDDVLRQVGTMLAREVRAHDSVYRYGGEEFCILLSGATMSDAERVAQRLVNSARKLVLPGDVRITLSAGVADGTAADVAHTLHAADQALLEAKRSGRDRAVETVRA